MKSKLYESLNSNLQYNGDQIYVLLSKLLFPKFLLTKQFFHPFHLSALNKTIYPFLLV